MMKDAVYKNLSKRHAHKFGEIAINTGFITEKQLKEALIEQVEDKLSNRPHRFIGYILFENGWITKEQFDSILNILFKKPV